MKRSILHIILLLWAMLPATTAHSQSYPVQSNVYVVAPYSQTYSDYYADGQQRMFVNILLNDMSQGHLDVVLRFSIKSNNLKLTSKLTGNVQPITIHSGKMYRVEGSELAQYLRVDDMQAEGRLAGEFQKSGKLPEGYYEIKVEVVEYYRRANVSAPSYSTMWIMQPEAPVWTMPQNNAKIDAISPQFMLFGWMMTGNTSMLRNIKYEFSIYEKPASMSADVVVKTSTPIYREELTQQTLVYGPDKPLLELGKVYACRVKVEDGDGLVSFKNDGYSSTLVFKYGEECDPPTQVTITDITKKGATVNWVSDQSHSGYDVEVRELSDGKSSDWFTWKIDKRQYNYEIKQLSSDSRYECRVAAVCGQRTNGIRSAYTDPVEFKTYAAGNKKYNCGDLVEASKPTNQVPYPYLNEGDLITANGHAFVVESISKASGSVFSGQCLWNIEIWNVNILCDFIDIEVNALGELLRGKIVACHDKAQAKAFTRLQSAAYMPAGTQVPSSYKADKIMAMTETVDSVRIVDGETLIYVAGQNPVKVAATDNVFVRSADGNYYAVEDGKVYPKPSNLDKDGNRTLSYDQLITATFGYDDNLGRHAGVDAYSDAKKPFASQYSQYQLHSNDAYATWIAKSQTAIPIARVTVSGGDRAALQFRNGGQTIAATSAADADALYLPLTADGQYDAYYTTQDTHGADLEVMAGQLIVVSYPQQNINVCLVEVNGASYPRTSNELSNYLNDVFGQAVFGVNLTKTSIEVDKFNGTLSAKESGALSAYNSDMKKLIRKVKKLPDYTDDTYYIMLVAKSDNPALGGFMPVNSNFGFVFAQANSGAGQMNRTIAHELAHGAFRLWHTFSSENLYTAQQGTTRNLMDYNGTNAELFKYQWDYIHNPQQGIVRWLVEDEESEAWKEPGTKILCINDENVINEIRKYRYFYLPNGDIADFEKYVVSGFYAEDDVTPEARGAVATIRIKNYDNATLFETDEKTKTHTIVGWGYDIGNNLARKVIDISKVTVNPQNAEPVRVYITDKNVKIEKNGNIIETLTLENDCNCIYKQESKCEALLEKYANSPIMQNNTLRTAILKDPCILDGPMLHFGMEVEKSQWMKEFEMVFGIAVHAVLLPAEMAILLPVAFEATLESFSKEEILRFAEGAIVEAAMYYCVSELIDDEIDWTDFSLDVFIAGLRNAAHISKIDQSILACIQGVQIGDIQEIKKMVFAKKYDDAFPYFIKTILDCSISGLFEYYGNNSSSKLMTTLQRSSMTRLSRFMNKLNLSQTLKEKLVKYLYNAEKVTTRSSEWKESITRLLTTDDGARAFDLLKQANFNISTLSSKNFERLSNIVSKFDEKEAAKIVELFGGVKDYNQLLIYLEHSGSTAEQYIKAMNRIAEKGLFDNTITFGSKTMNVKEFLFDYTDELITYYHGVDNGILYYYKLIKIEDGVAGFVIALDAASKNVLYDGECRVIVNKVNKEIDNLYKITGNEE